MMTRENDIEVIEEFVRLECDYMNLTYLFSDYDVDSYIHEVIVSNGERQKVLYFKVLNGEAFLGIYDDEWSCMGDAGNVRDFWILVAPAIWPEPPF